MIAQISHEAAYTAALVLETEAKHKELPLYKRRALRQAAEALWAIINDTDAIELEGRHVEET